MRYVHIKDISWICKFIGGVYRHDMGELYKEKE